MSEPVITIVKVVSLLFIAVFWIQVTNFLTVLILYPSSERKMMQARRQYINFPTNHEMDRELDAMYDYVRPSEYGPYAAKEQSRFNIIWLIIFSVPMVLLVLLFIFLY